MVFDNAKLRRVVPGWQAVIPFEQGAREIADWYLADPARQVDRRGPGCGDGQARGGLGGMTPGIGPSPRGRPQAR